MKNVFALLVLIFTSQTLLAQQRPADSLIQLLNTNTSDTNRINNLTELGKLMDFSMAKGDSSKKYLEEAQSLAKKIGDTKLEAIATFHLAGNLYRTANYPQALILSLENLKKLEQLKRDKNISYSFNQGRDLLFYQIRLLSFIYANIGDAKMQLSYVQKMRALYNASLAQKGRLNNYALTIYYNLANAYENLKMPDSTLHYRSLVYNEASITKEPQWLALSANLLGEYYAQQNRPDTAMKLFRQSIPAAIESKRNDVVISNELSIGQLYKKSGNMDSAFYYARQVLKRLASLNNPSRQLSAYQLLSELYRDTRQYDSAYKYLQNFTTLKDSLNDQTKLTEAQNFVFNQNLLEQQVEQAKRETRQQNATRIKLYALVAVIAFVLLATILLMRNLRNKRAANILLTQQKEEIQHNLVVLKEAQAQLIHAEKMASLGELTAGIAHEIQNPLNFVNNFSEVSRELIDELKLDKGKLTIEEQEEILNDLDANLEKINQHGKRADAIVKGMLQHSRSSSGQKEITDINALCDEYLRLSYHGLRAKEKSFNAKLETDFDASIAPIPLIRQDVGRVILNLLTNAFYAVSERKKNAAENYEPTVLISTKKIANKILIKVSDNGDGIPQEIVGKIFQPFFTTKPTGKGTGLGLSLSYDIIKAHNGTMSVDSTPQQGTAFTIELPLSEIKA